MQKNGQNKSGLPDCMYYPVAICAVAGGAVGAIVGLTWPISIPILTIGLYRSIIK